jgi:hypothetical protein
MAVLAVSLVAGCQAHRPPAAPTGAPIPAPPGTTVAHAGAPVGAFADYDALFSRLHEAGVTAFYPQGGVLVDFVTAPGHDCNPNGPGFAALRRWGMGLIVPGFLLYPRGAPVGGGDADPLRRLITCAGRSHIFAVTNYDEPAFAVALDDVAKLYQRVKSVDATIPVAMVHAPIPRAIYPGSGPCVTPPAAGCRPPIPVSDYLDRVRQHSDFADWVGFDVYPAPSTPDVAALITTPYRDGLPAQDHRSAVGDYARWLAANIHRPFFMALQGFSFRRNSEATSAYCLASNSLRDPTSAELTAMSDAAVDSGAFMVVWWGMHLLHADDTLYSTVLEVSGRTHQGTAQAPNSVIRAGALADGNIADTAAKRTSQNMLVWSTPDWAHPPTHGRLTRNTSTCAARRRSAAWSASARAPNGSLSIWPGAP